MSDAPLRILCVYAHPDDESFGPAALLARYAREGAFIAGIWATCGEHGQPIAEPPPSSSEMARLREQDVRDACTEIGIQSVTFLRYEDGTLDKVPPDDLVAAVSATIQTHEPNVVLTFGPGGITGHPDHVAVHKATTEAFSRAREAGLPLQALFYDAVSPENAKDMGIANLPDGSPNTWIDIVDTFPVKLRALRIHARHVKDAVDMAERLTVQPQTRTPLHRAWPRVPAGTTLSALV